MEMLTSTIFFGIGLTLVAYMIGLFIKKKTNSSILNPLLISNILVIVILLATKTEYSTYMKGGQYLTYLLTPATVCLAVPLYEKLNVLKSNLKAIMIGTLAGVLTMLTMALVFSMLFGFSHSEYVSIMGKSITSPIGIGLSEELGGNPAVTVALIVITGIFGNMIAEPMVKLLNLKSPVAKGIAIGTSSHVIGTTKALEMGEIEGAMSSLAITIAGLMTVIVASFYAGIY
ncbi:MAG: LrgB family protein [Clostridiaceae bacterium]